MKIDKNAYARLSATEKAEVDKLLAEYQAVLEHNPLARYYPHDKQVMFHASKDQVKAFFAGNRGGKTTSGIVDDIIQAVDEDCVPSHLKQFKKWQPPFYCRIIAPDFTGSMEGVIFTKLREWLPKNQLVGDSWDAAYDKQRRMVRFKNGSWFQFLTSEQDVDKHAGAALHRVHFDEEPGGDKGWALYRENRMRLIDYGGDLILTLTPEHGLSWCFDQIWEKRFEPNITCISASSFDNPHVPASELEAAMSSLSKEERERKIEGKFVHLTGRVYPEFSEKHIIDEIEPSHLNGQSVVVAIDPGIRTTGVTFNAFDRDDAMLTFDELRLTDHTVDQVSELILRKCAGWGISPYFVIDPSGRNRTGMGDNMMTEYARCGIVCGFAVNDVEVGIGQLKRRMQSDPPLVLVTKNCVGLLWELDRYRIKDSGDGSFQVVKKDDHVMDAWRYGACTHIYGPVNIKSKAPRDRGSLADPWWENQSFDLGESYELGY